LVFTACCLSLAGDYVGRTGTFSAFSDLEFDILAFIERCIAGRLNFRVVNKQIIATTVRLDEAKALT